MGANALFFWIHLQAATIVSFDAPVSISLSGADGAASSEAGDFDNDGKSEFISAATQSTSDAHLRIYYHDAQGFSVINVLPDAEVEARQDRFGGDLTTADINGDGWTDIIVPSSANGSGSGTLSWFENPDGNRNGTWIEHVISTWSGSGTGQVVAHMSEVDVGDIDGDGKLDVVTRDISHGVFLLLQKTDGSGWQPRRFVPTNPREGLDLFNPDGDSDLDIILNGVWLETPSDPLTGDYIVHTYGAEWYPIGNSSAEIRDYACQIAVADFNEDGRDDIAISNSEELNNASSTDSKPKGIQLFLAPVDPKTEPWTKVVVETEHFSWHSLELADLDFNGSMDFISAISSVGADNAPKQVSIFLNNGLGTSFTKYPVVSSSIPLVYNSTLADSDGDGDLDLFAPDSFNAGPMRYFENTTITGPVDDESPTAPLGLTATATVGLHIDLNWSAASDNIGVAGYRIYQGGQAIATTAALDFAVTNLEPLTVYAFTVTALDGAGNESLHSAMAYTTTGEAPPKPDLDDSLVAYWRLDEGQGTVATDVVSGLEGSSQAPLSWQPAGKIGGAIDFDGTVSRLTVPGLDIAGSEITLAAWVRPRSFAGTANEARFISKASSTTGNDHYWMLGNYENGTALRFRLKTGSTTTTLISAEGQIETDKWYHVAATYDGTTMRIFLDGVEIASERKTGNLATASSVDVGLGNQPEGAGDRALDGLLDEIRIYNKALSASELMSIMESPIDNWAATFDLPAGLSLDNDDDDDGVPLLLEYALGTSPLEKSSVPVSYLFNEEGIRYYFPKLREELRYQVEISHDLLTWDTEGVTQGTGEWGKPDSAVIPLSGSGESVFVRLVVQP